MRDKSTVRGKADLVILYLRCKEHIRIFCVFRCRTQAPWFIHRGKAKSAFNYKLFNVSMVIKLLWTKVIRIAVVVDVLKCNNCLF